MKIELKKFHFSEQLSGETNAFTADIYVEGVKTAYAKNNGQGGSTMIHPYEGKREILKKAEAYAKSLPPQHLKEYDLTIESSLDRLIDDLVEAELKKRDAKKMERKFAKAICWGVPGGPSYTQVTFKRPLAEIPVERLRIELEKYRSKFKPGEVFLNTNLATLGI